MSWTVYRSDVNSEEDFRIRWLDLTREVGHFLQHPLWGTFKEAFHWQAVRVAVGDGKTFQAGAQVLFRRLVGGWTLAYVPRGPIWRQHDPESIRMLVGALDQVARERHAIFLKVEPDWEDTPDARALLRRTGFRPSFQTVQPRSTVQVDLTPEPEEILARMKSKWRYNIRLARRKGVVVQPADEKSLDIFLRLMEETARRDGFALHTSEYYRRAWRLFVPEGLGTLLMAWYEALPLAGIFVTTWGQTAIYMYGASSNRERQRMPNHLLQWEGMLWARGQGAVVYDMWGIPDEGGAHPEAWAHRTPERTDGLWGVFRFKQGFGGRILRTVGAWDRVYREGLYRVYRWAWQLRSRRA